MSEEQDNKAPFSEGEPCERCGKFGAYQFDGKSLCSDCYQGCGSCCPEFGADDLWQSAEERSTHKTHETKSR
jgi:hypothetical protein